MTNLVSFEYKDNLHIHQHKNTSWSIQFMKDWHLVAILFVFITIDVIILVVVTAIADARFGVSTIPDKEYPGEFVDVS